MRKLSPRGQGLVEYALILVIVALTVLIVVRLLGPAFSNMFGQVVSNI